MIEEIKNPIPSEYERENDAQYSDYELQYAVLVRKEIEQESVQELKVANG